MTEGPLPPPEKPLLRAKETCFGPSPSLLPSLLGVPLLGAPHGHCPIPKVLSPGLCSHHTFLRPCLTFSQTPTLT